MIPHPTVATLLAQHGNTAAGRRRAREALVASAEEFARQEGRLLGLSAHCEDDVRAGAAHHRCRNDGSTCLCACHDPAEAEAAPAASSAAPAS